MKVLVTGATGFVGRELIPRLFNSGVAVRTSSRSNCPFPGGEHVASDLEQATDLSHLTAGCDAVIHLAALTHGRASLARTPQAFHRINVDGTRKLLDAALRTSVRRFVYVSSIKVSGECTDGRRPFTADDPANPQDDYGSSKLAAELLIRSALASTAMDFTIVRPPLVYGPGAKANFAAIARAVRLGYPLPLKSVRNARSFVSVQNLADLLVAVTGSTRASRRTFVVSDGHDLSTPDLAKAIGAAVGVAPRLLPCPPALLHAALRLAGLPGMYQRLCLSLQVDISETRSLLGWQPCMSVADSLRAALCGSTPRSEVGE